MPSVLADVVWPALYLEQYLFSIWPILVGLVAEWFFLYFGGFGLSWKKAIIVDVVMNAVSSVAGIALIPVLGLLWELGPGSIVNDVFNVGTFNPVSWIANFLLAASASTAIEAAVVRWGFKIPLGRKRLWILFGANAVSTGIAFASFWIHPPKF